MDLTKELLNLLQRAKEEGEYHDPWIIQGVLYGIEVGNHGSNKIIPKDIEKWAQNMYSR